VFEERLLIIVLLAITIANLLQAFLLAGNRHYRLAALPNAVTPLLWLGVQISLLYHTEPLPAPSRLQIGTLLLQALVLVASLAVILGARIPVRSLWIALFWACWSLNLLFCAVVGVVYVYLLFFFRIQF
jgi:hypothetical protein